MSDPVSAGVEGEPRREVVEAAAELQRAQQDLQRLAIIELLTRLLHRQAFDERVQQALAEASARSRQCALV